MKNIKVIGAVFILAFLFFMLPSDISASASYKVEYGKGLYVIYSVTGEEPDNFIKGSAPSSVHVDEGGSVIVAQSSYTFRDYYFGGWRYSYNTSEGNSASKVYQPGDTIENITCNMKLEAIWRRKSIDIRVSGVILFDEGDGRITKPEGTYYIGEVISLPSASLEGYDFEGWTDAKGVFFKADDIYTVESINSSFTAVWSKNGVKESFYKITVECSGGGTVSPSRTMNVRKGSSHTFVISPDEGKKIIKITKNGVAEKLIGNSYTFTADGDTALKFVFADQSVQIESTAKPSASASETYATSPFSTHAVTTGSSISTVTTESQSSKVAKGSTVALVATMLVISATLIAILKIRSDKSNND